MSCEILVEITDGGDQIFSDPSQGPFDGSDDTLIGVLNDSGNTLTSLQLSGSSDLFGFDGDGLCSGDYSGTPAGCPFGPTGYEGPGTSFTDINADDTGGDVDFSPGIAPGGTAYFSLEEPLTATTVFSGGPSRAEQGGAPNASEQSTTCSTANPVNCATGTFWHTFTDASVPGPGVPLDFTRTYSSADATTNGPLGYGWTDSYAMSLSFDSSGDATITQEDGSTATFDDSGGSYIAPPWTLASFVANGDGTYTFTRDSTNIQYVFNSSGQLTKEIDRNGYTTTLSYNSAGQLVTVTDASGRTLTLDYNSNALIDSVTDPLGNTTTYSYDSSGNLASVTDAMGRSWTFTYDSTHLLLAMTDPDGGTTTNTYNSSDQVTQQVDPAGRSTTWAYSGDPTSGGGGTTTITDPNDVQTVQEYSNLELTSITKAAGTPTAATTTYTYDPATLGRSSVTDPNGNTTTNAYNSRGELTSSTDPQGNTTTYSYDAEGDLLSVTDPLGNATTYTYDANGNLLTKSTPISGGGDATWTYTYGTGSTDGEMQTSSDPDANTTTYAYDSDGDQASITDALGNKTTKTYDADGNLLSTTTPKGDTTGYTYNADNELTRLTNPLSNSITYTLNGDGDRTSVTDANGHKTTYSYDADNELTAIGYPGGSSAKTSYDADGNVTGQTDGDGDTTSYSYTPLTLVARATNPDGKQTSYSYDEDGNLLAVADASDQTTSYTYDPDNQVTGVNYSDGTTPDVTERYDADGRRTSLTDGTGTSTFSYNPAGQLTSETDGAGQTIGYSYDSAGNLTAITYPNGQTVNQSYNSDDEVASVSDWLGNKVSFGYDSDGNQTDESLPGSVTSAVSYDAAGQPTTIADSNGGGTIGIFDYARDPNGQVNSASASGAVTGSDTYSYDAQNQLTTDNATGYGYDAAGNPTTYAGQKQRFDAANELQSSAPAPSSTTTTTTTSSSTGSSTTSSTTTSSRPATRRRSVTIESIASTTRPGVSGTLTASVDAKQPGDVLLVLVSAQLRKGVAQISSSARRGARIRWSMLLERSARRGLVVGWTAEAASSGSIKVRVKVGRRVSQALLTVVAFAPRTQVGVHAVRTGTRGAPRVQLRNTIPGAQLWAVGHDSVNGRARTPLPGETLVSHVQSRSHHDASWAQYGRASSVGVVNVGEQLPASRGWLLAGIVVEPALPQPGNELRDLLAGQTGEQRTFGYNADGDRTSVTTGETITDLGYDQANQLTSVGSTIAYTYDGDGLRASKSVNGTTTAYGWDEAGSLPVLLQDGSTYYIYGPGGQPIEQVTGGTAQFLLADQQGSTRLITDTSGNVDGTYSYDPWGNVTSHTGSATTNLQYDGQYTDSETGYQYLRRRYYDPTTGQFLTVDPDLTETAEPYDYAQNDPVSLIDPSGANALSDLLGTAVDESFHWLVTNSQELGRVKVLGVLNPISDVETLVSGGETIYDCVAWGVDTVSGGNGHAERLECGGSAASTANNLIGLIPVVGSGISTFLDEVTSEGQAGSNQGWYDANPCDALYGHVLYP